MRLLLWVGRCDMLGWVTVVIGLAWHGQKLLLLLLRGSARALLPIRSWLLLVHECRRCRLAIWLVEVGLRRCVVGVSNDLRLLWRVTC